MLMDTFARQETPREVDIDELMLNAEQVQTKNIHVCRKTRAIRNVTEAKVLGAAIYDYFYERQRLRTPFAPMLEEWHGSYDGNVELKVEEMERTLLQNSRVRRALRKLFDPAGMGVYVLGLSVNGRGCL
jgi:hypothetical protein